ncbi:MAG: cytochrome c biogenesis protein CcsA, partial [Nonlabens sp.]
KWTTLTLHISWILIIIGAGITRYVSYEGMMLIREGEVENTFRSDETYFTAIIQGEDPNGNPMQREVKEKVLLSQFDYKREQNFEFYDQDISLTIDSLIYDATEGLKPSSDPNAGRYLTVVEAGGGSRHDHLLKDGEEASIHNVLFGVNIDPDIAREKGLINITENWNGYTIQTPYEGEYLRMADQFKGEVVKDSVQPLQLRSLYTVAGMQFVIPGPIEQGEVGIIPSPEPTQAKALGLLATVRSGEEERKIELLGGKGILSDYEDIELNNLKVYLKYGSIERELPFKIKLNDFIANKYPGTENSYSSFESKVTVMDDGVEKDEHIYMNNVLDKEGYRFFQASFDKDELGTHLSVNHDFWGTNITYAGYFLLYLGLLAILFDRNTRFAELGRLIDRVKKRKAKQLATAIMLLIAVSAGAQTVQDDSSNQKHDEELHENHKHGGVDHTTGLDSKNAVSTNRDAGEVQEPIRTQVEQPIVVPEYTKSFLDSIIVTNLVPIAQAEKFAKVVVQDDDGRMKPMGTLASEALRKLYKQTHYEAQTGDSIVKVTPVQVMLSMIQLRALWFDVPLIKLERKDDTIKNLIGLDRKAKYARGYDFFRNADGSLTSSKLNPFLDDAYAAQIRSGYQERIVDKDQKVNLLDRLIVRSLFKVFPKPADANNKWVSEPEWQDEAFVREEDKAFVRDFFPAYASLLMEGQQTGNYLRANTALNSLFEFQKTYGAAVYPSEDKINAELLYNKYNIFEALYKWYYWFGIVMLVLLIVQVIKPMKELRYAINFHLVVLIALFAVHVAGLAMRWYLSGHAPWSDAYETLIYIPAVIMAFGFAVGRKSLMTIAASAFIAGVILMIAQWNWMDPAIANLQPVLQGYWLMIHVSVIVGSYGPFALGFILGLITLILMIFSTQSNKARMDLTIKELTYINEVALTVGLIMLTIGNFLGGMWANESWGRYWGWDPKETWALITIFIYAFVLHLRLVPGLKGRWTFNLWSMLAFYSVMMTYFGVNFYLSGLHSYASGDQIVSYEFIGYSLLIIAAVAILARWREFKIYGKRVG